MRIRLHRKVYPYILLTIGIIPNVWAAVTEDDLSLVEDEINTIKEERDTATKLSGYVDAEYINDSRNSAIMNAQGDKYGFRIRHLSLFVTKKFNQKWSFFSEAEFEDGTFIDSGGPASNTSGSIYAESINMDYQWRPSQYLRIGRDFTPAGIWSTDHYPPFVATQDTPMFFEAHAIFPGVIDGVDAHGTLPIGKSFLEYDAYVANGDSTPGQSDNNRQKAFGGRVNFILPAFKLLHIGASFFRDTDPYNYTGDPSVMLDSRKTSYGFHGKLKVDNWTVQAEYAQDTRKPLDGGATAETKQVGYYLQALYDVNQWSIGYRYDFFNPDKSASTKVDAKDNVVFVDYHVSPVIVCKLEHHMVKDHSLVSTYGKADYSRTILSIAYYLGE